MFDFDAVESFLRLDGRPAILLKSGAAFVLNPGEDFWQPINISAALSAGLMSEDRFMESFISRPLPDLPPA